MQADSPRQHKTIFALATPPGKSGVAVIRLSGAASAKALRQVAGECPPPRRASFRPLRDPASGELLDRGLVLFFPAPASFTGEDVGELQIHGSLAVIEGVLEALSRLPNLEAAQAGEFAKRAFLNGKMDLTQAEGLGDLIEAQSSAQRALALRQADGGLHRLVEALRQQVLALRARLEALLDFPDEEVPSLSHELLAAIAPLAGQIDAQLKQGHAGEILREGAKAVLLGAPNVGKSSLFNHLLAREAALTSPQAGTTRDVLEAHLSILGYKVILQDSAGLDEDKTELAARARQRAVEAGREADIRLLVRAPDGVFMPEPKKGDLLICNKIDLADGKTIKTKAGELKLSAATGEGMAALRHALGERAKTLCRPAELAPLMTHARHRSHLLEAQAAIAEAKTALADNGAAELAAESLRRAGQALGRMTGQNGIEEVLDLVFSRFCIGK